jgi:hypothetical protein
MFSLPLNFSPNVNLGSKKEEHPAPQSTNDLVIVLMAIALIFMSGAVIAMSGALLVHATKS